jgi:hypothetical protein
MKKFLVLFFGIGVLAACQKNDPQPDESLIASKVQYKADGVAVKSDAVYLFQRTLRGLPMLIIRQETRMPDGSTSNEFGVDLPIGLKKGDILTYPLKKNNEPYNMAYYAPKSGFTYFWLTNTAPSTATIKITRSDSLRLEGDFSATLLLGTTPVNLSEGHFNLRLKDVFSTSCVSKA